VNCIHGVIFISREDDLPYYLQLNRDLHDDRK
jgi:hypothetical protein